jgi:hypothetical protein
LLSVLCKVREGKFAKTTRKTSVADKTARRKPACFQNARFGLKTAKTPHPIKPAIQHTILPKKSEPAIDPQK